MQIGARTTGGLVSISVTTGGSAYTSAPSVTISGGSGSGATAVCHMAGTRVESIVIGNAGTGYTSNPTITISGGGGTGAAATATAYTGSLRPLSMFKGRYGDLYGVDGMGRGFRWDGAATSVERLGIAKPSMPPAITSSASSSGGYVSGVQMVAAGAGYHSAPTVTFTGGSATSSARAIASVQNGRVTGIRVTDPGSGYQTNPTVSLSGGIGTGAVFSVSVIGTAGNLTLASPGTGYTSNGTTSPTVQFSTGQGLTSAYATVAVAGDGTISAVALISGGTGATTSGVTASIVGGGGTGASLDVSMLFSVAALTASSSGSGYYTPPQISFRPAVTDPSGFGAGATATVNASGNVSGANVYAGGQYGAIPTAYIADTTAKAQASVAFPMKGRYKCAIRYLDDTPESQNGPIPSSISWLQEIDAGGGAGQLTWSFTHDGIEDRVHSMELWRTSAEQSVVLYRVATILRSDAAFTGTYTDTLTDIQLQDTARADYALMPITLPSGQINARRFEIPPGNYAVACMFQDRAWYAVDATGAKPNSLFYSEIDEPESVPEANELVVQENTTETDSIVALIPLGSELLIAQRAHVYKLNYVAQPVLDASLILGAYRGILNSRCWDILGGVAFIADSNGLYAYDGTNEDPVSVPVDNYWRDRIIDFSKSDKFHLKADMTTRTVRFYYCNSGDSEPVRALCFCVASKAWWEEVYPYAATAACPMVLGGKYGSVFGTDGGFFVKPEGLIDIVVGGGMDAAPSPISYEFRTGPGRLKDEGGSRTIGVLYHPTVNDSTLQVRLHYNNSSTPRANAISSDRGNGFTTTLGSTAATLNMKKAQSLGEANGFAKAYYAGRQDDRSSGGDRHIAVAVAGTQAATTGNSVVIYGITVEGAE